MAFNQGIEMGASVPLESILCTDELDRRSKRPPDYETENRALVAAVTGSRFESTVVISVSTEPSRTRSAPTAVPRSSR